MKKLLANKRGEGYINTAVIIIIAVVIGGLLLGGLYLIFAGDGGVMENLDKEVKTMLHYNEPAASFQFDGESKMSNFQYSYDGEDWLTANVPTEVEDTSVLNILQQDNMVVAVVYGEECGTCIISSVDGGINWQFCRKAISAQATNVTIGWEDGGKLFRVFVYQGSTDHEYISHDTVSWRYLNAPILWL